MLGCVEGLDALTLDLPGFGASPVPPEAWGASQYADLLVPVLETFHAPPVVVGFSFGGRVAVCLAAKRPDLVRALVLTGAPLLRKSASPTKAPLAFRIAKVAHRFGLLSDERMEEERRKRGSADYRAATGIMRNVLVRVVNETYENELRALQCPVDFVWGENDTAAPVEMVRRAEDLVSAPTSLEIISGRTHFLPLEEPAPIRDAIVRRLS